LYVLKALNSICIIIILILILIITTIIMFNAECDNLEAATHQTHLEDTVVIPPGCSASATLLIDAMAFHSCPRKGA